MFFAKERKRKTATRKPTIPTNTAGYNNSHRIRLRPNTKSAKRIIISRPSFRDKVASPIEIGMHFREY